MLLPVAPKPNDMVATPTPKNTSSAVPTNSATKGIGWSTHVLGSATESFG
jgi:hypothetical protein